MPLTPGTRLGPYEILAPLGAGGMGEVYRARDTKLKREVALKVLPDSLATDPGRMARFQREAEVLALLNHPHIAHIYGVEDDALIMELVEGETLPSRLPADTALRYALQIAEGLEYAHERGIVHRDLKPGNIKVTPEGTVKLLDFGLAKAVENPGAASGDPANSPTLTLGVTNVGVIMGTAAYMSPEQAGGKTVDRRADIWSFGAVLYEVLSGRRAFAGDSVSDTLAGVLKVDPDWKALPSDTPTAVRRLIQRCLTKDRKQRLQAIGDARIAIEEVLSGASLEAPQPAPAGRRIVPWAVAGVLAIALAIMSWVWWDAARPVAQPLVRLDVDLGPDISLLPMDLTNAHGNRVLLSPDGRRMVYLASKSGGPQRLFTRKLDQPEATELRGTDGAESLFLSPDGEWIAFDAASGLSKIPVEGGPVVRLSDYSFGGCWGEAGNIIADKRFGEPMSLIPSSGGAAVPLTPLAAGEFGHGYAQVLPGGKAALFAAFRAGLNIDETSIEVITMADRRRRTLVRGGNSPHYVAGSSGSGYLLYSHLGTLFAIPFDLGRLETRGAAVAVLDDVEYEPLDYSAHFDISRNGTLVYRKGSAAGSRGATGPAVQWLEGDNKKTPLLAQPGWYGTMRLSPDGKRLAVVVWEAKRAGIWIYDLQRDTMTRLTFDRLYYDAIWSPDGRYVLFTTWEPASKLPAGSIWWARADGTSQPRPLTQSNKSQLPCSFSPDGKRLAYQENNGSDRWQIWTVPVEDSGGQLRAGKPEQFLGGQFNYIGARFSPDGRWLAYLSDESGRKELFVRAFPPRGPGQDGKWQISNHGVDWRYWSLKSRELLYQSDDQVMSVSYTVQGDTFVPGKPRVWLAKLGGATVADMAPDGKRLAIIPPPDPKEAPKPEHEVTFLFNFLDELRRRVPAGK